MNNKVVPAVNQVECHPFYQKTEAIKHMEELGVKCEAWGPFAEAGRGIFTNPVLVGIAKKHNKTVAQVVLRWNVQRGVIVIPKSVHKERIIENFNIWDFQLDQEDMDAIAKLDTNKSTIIDHYDLGIIRYVNTHKIHD